MGRLNICKIKIKGKRKLVKEKIIKKRKGMKSINEE